MFKSWCLIRICPFISQTSVMVLIIDSTLVYRDYSSCVLTSSNSLLNPLVIQKNISILLSLFFSVLMLSWHFLFHSLLTDCSFGLWPLLAPLTTVPSVKWWQCKDKQTNKKKKSFIIKTFLLVLSL